MRVDVKKDSDGVWCCRPYLGLDALGRQIRPYRRFPAASTREEAQALADAWAAHLTADGRVRSARLECPGMLMQCDGELQTLDRASVFAMPARLLLQMP